MRSDRPVMVTSPRPSLGTLGRAVLDALPGWAIVVDKDGALLTTNGRAPLALSGFFGGLAVQRGEDLIAALRLAPAQPAGRVILLDVANGLERVLDGVVPVVEFDVAQTATAGMWSTIRISPLPAPQGGALVLVTDGTDRVAARERLNYQSTHDIVTGMANRLELVSQLTGALSRPGRQSVAVLTIDIDRFKLVNATLGADWGDVVLRHVAERFAGSLSFGESIGRVGADSFAVISDRAYGGSTALVLAERLRETLRTPLVIDGESVVLTVSIGVAIAGPTVTNANDALRDSELGMLQARQHGGDRVVVAHQELRRVSAHRHEVEQALRGVLDRKEFWLDYQPVVSLDSGLVVGAEALLRWEHPTLGLLPPSEFIGVAEETGLIVPIGEWVLREACMQAAEWFLPADDHRELYVAVNVSARQLADPGLIDVVMESLRASGLPAGRLCLEVTESVLLQHLDGARNALARLRRMGIRVALDDFGTGYASFEYLVRLPVDIVKLDASFVARLASDASDRVVVESVAALAQRLGIQMVAEGVEDAEQQSLLASLGCNVAQGFDLGRPGDSASLLAAVWRRAGNDGSGVSDQS